jgi:hypothetical protein
MRTVQILTRKGPVLLDYQVITSVASLIHACVARVYLINVCIVHVNM